MNNQYTITDNDISRINEFIVEDINQNPNISDIEELAGMYLENTAGVDLLDDNEIANLITNISNRVKQSLIL